MVLRTSGSLRTCFSADQLVDRPVENIEYFLEVVLISIIWIGYCLAGAQGVISPEELDLMLMIRRGNPENVLQIAAVHYKDAVEACEVVDTQLPAAVVDRHAILQGIPDGAGIRLAADMVVGGSAGIDKKLFRKPQFCSFMLEYSLGKG